MEEKISKKAVRRVLSEYGRQYKRHPWLTGISFILPALGTILVFYVPPLILAKLIDIFSARGYISLQGIGNYIILFAALWFLGEVFWRVGMHLLIRLEAHGTKNLSTFACCKLKSRE